jgi:hypothetical protein
MHYAVMVVYPIDFFDGVVFGGKYGTPPPDAMSSLAALSQLVGSPSYSRTPNFKRAAFENKQWENFRVFKKTEIVIEPTTVAEACTTVVRGLLNKLTENTVESTTVAVLSTLDSNALASGEISELCDVVCEIGSGSAYYASIYAKIVATMLEQVDEMRAAIGSKLEGFAGSLREIRSVSSEDYDAFCQMNAEKEARKGSGLFVINLAKNGVVPQSYVTDTCVQLTALITECLDDQVKRQHVEDMVAMFIAFLREMGPDMRSVAAAGTGMAIDGIIRDISGMDRKARLGLSSKTVFAAMDYIEEFP